MPSSSIHCDEFRATFAVPNRIPRADVQLRINAEDGYVKGKNYYGIKLPVGNALFFIRPFGPKDTADASHLTIDGNPSKVPSYYGLHDCRTPFDAMQATCRTVLKVLRVAFDADAKKGIVAGQVTISRVHLAAHFHVGPGNTPQVLEALKADFQQRGIKFSSEGYGRTVYVNKVDLQESRYWVLVFYDKHAELLAHRPAGISDLDYHRVLGLARGVRGGPVC